MRRAGRIDRNQPEIVKALRAMGIEVEITSHVHGGFPDLVCRHPREPFARFIEVKDGERPPCERRLTPAEEAFAARFPVHVVENVDDALAVFGLRRAGNGR